jgi:hypothetical protein
MGTGQNETVYVMAGTKTKGGRARLNPNAKALRLGQYQPQRIPDKREKHNRKQLDKEMKNDVP